MDVPRMKPAQLDDDRLAKVRAMEAELGKLLVALEPKYPLAELSDEQVQKLRALERELGVVLLAYGQDA